MAVSLFSGLIAGYDPGGNGRHGVALAHFANGACTKLSVKTMPDAEAVILWLEDAGALEGIGIDTLACWSTGPSGWRPADLWLGKQYKPLQSSVVSPNGLYGSMGLNGMAVLQAIRKSHPSLRITETHPKVLYYALAGTKCNYVTNSQQMDAWLSEWLGVTATTTNDHEWDAAVSVLSALRGIEGAWTHDLFKEPSGNTGRLVFPSGPANYWWPD